MFQSLLVDLCALRKKMSKRLDRLIEKINEIGEKKGKHGITGAWTSLSALLWHTRKKCEQTVQKDVTMITFLGILHILFCRG